MTLQFICVEIERLRQQIRGGIVAGTDASFCGCSVYNLVFAYILYLLGRTEYGVDEFALRGLIARWFFMTALTGRYSSSPESKMEFDLARLRELKDADAFVAVLVDISNATLTNDYWSVTLPSDLATASANSPSMYAFFAALNLLEARVLFSRHKVTELLDPTTKSNKSALERHHLFPKGHLKTLGINGTRETNQIANFTMIEWGDNGEISDTSPSKYVPLLSKRFDETELAEMQYWHALPDNWQDMPYQDFLRKRRERMAIVIRDAYKKLAGDVTTSGKPPFLPVMQLVVEGEGTNIEFKSTLRINLHTRQKDSKIELAALKTVAAFLNMSGGTLVIGVADDGEPVGIEADEFPSEDNMNLHLVNLIKERMGTSSMMYVHPRFGDYHDARVMVLDCAPSKVPVFVKDSALERFYVRTGAATSELTASQTQDFIKQRFSH